MDLTTAVEKMRGIKVTFHVMRRELMAPEDTEERRQSSAAPPLARIPRLTGSHDLESDSSPHLRVLWFFNFPLHFIDIFATFNVGSSVLALLFIYFVKKK